MSFLSRRAAARAEARRAFWMRIARVALRVALALVAVGMITAMALLTAYPPINVVETGATPEYPDIQPRAWSMSRDRVFAGAVEVVEALDTFTLVDADPDAGVVRAEALSRTGWWIDDVEIRVEANGEGGTIVFVRSASRVGRGDFGQNARNVRVVLNALDDNLGGATARSEI